ncbi:MAG: SRPBCC family protein [Planctomycetes bacterium]|nr:SRPBCC family protein [Planctomycetota bacterium]
MADPKKQKGGGSVLLKLVVFVVLLVILVGAGGYFYGTTLEAKRVFSETVSVKGDEDDVHKYIGDLKQWPEWGPWKDGDPEMTWTFSENTTEVGSWTRWVSKHGNGELKFTAVDPEKGVEYLFTMEGWDPQKGSIVYTDTDEGINVTWNSDMDMSNSIMGRYFIKFGEAEMNKMLTDGLSKLKTKVEAD